MVLLNNDEFLAELSKMFQMSRSKGAVRITMKRYDGKTTPFRKDNKLSDSIEYNCLVRATINCKKISTVIQQKDAIKFQLAYSSLLKSNFDGLKKLKRPKTKAKAT